ncbi:unnamed protein product [Urochloa humidicola]
MVMVTRRRRRSPPATASSPYFPPELISEVAKRLTNLQDFFALRAACRTYRSLLPLTSSKLCLADDAPPRPHGGHLIPCPLPPHPPPDPPLPRQAPCHKQIRLYRYRLPLARLPPRRL